MTSQLTLGPVLYNWPDTFWRDFYFQVADEAPVSTVYLGEAVCSKRAALVARHFDSVAARLERGGKKVVFSTLAQVSNNIDRRLVKRVATSEQGLVEVNDISALWHMGDRPHTIGPYMNVYNEDSLELFAEGGACSICLPPELPAKGIAALGSKARDWRIDLEVQVYGRIPLALSARCYHARAHDRARDSCRFVCDKDSDGMVLHTLDDMPFLAINGIQTQSYTCLNLVDELAELEACGVDRFRISPQSTGTIEAAETFQDALAGRISPDEATARLTETGPGIPFSNGFFHQRPGLEWQGHSNSN